MRDFHKEAEQAAVARLLKVGTGPRAALEDGRRVVDEAWSENLSDTELLEITALARAAAESGTEGDAATVGRIVLANIFDYALKCAEARHLVAQELADIHETEREAAQENCYDERGAA